VAPRKNSCAAGPIPRPPRSSRRFVPVAKLRADALVVAGEPFFDSKRERIVALSARVGVAAVYAWREYVLAGGLMPKAAMSNRSTATPYSITSSASTSSSRRDRTRHRRATWG